MRQDDVKAILVFDSASWWSMADIVRELVRVGVATDTRPDRSHALRILRSFERYGLAESRQAQNPNPVQGCVGRTITQWRWVA